MRNTLLFIYNPRAGKGTIRTKLATIVEAFSDAGYEVIVHPTSGPEDARITAERYTREGACDRIVCAGGDGTFAQTAGGILRGGTAIPLGFLPLGTTNDFAYSLRVPGKLSEAVKVAINGCCRLSDIGTINDTPFTYSAAFGLFTDVTYETPQSAKNALGRAAYLLNGASKLVNVKYYHLVVEGDGFTVEDDFVHGMIVNSDSVGGFKGITGKHVEFDDGFFEMIFIKRPKNILEWNSIVNSLMSHEIEQCPLIYYERVSRLVVTSFDELPWALDGDFGGDMRRAEIRIHKQKVSYIIGTGLPQIDGVLVDR